MDTNQKKFYKKNAEKYGKYDFHCEGVLVKGERPNFEEFLRGYADKNRTILDLGCGSGELTSKIAPLFKNVTGIDPFSESGQQNEYQELAEPVED